MTCYVSSGTLNLTKPKPSQVKVAAAEASLKVIQNNEKMENHESLRILKTHF